MAFSVEDLNDLIRALKQHPEWCMELRRVLLVDELFQLPELMRELIEVSRQHSVAISELTEAQRRTEQQVAELVEVTRQHSQQLAELTEISRQHSVAISELTEAQRRTEQQVAELAEISRQNVQAIAELREAQRRTEQQVAELAEISRQNVQAIAELREAQHRTEQQVAELVETTRRLVETTHDLVEWRRGEAGRRAGEQYEQRVIRRAMNIFLGGEGGSPEKPGVHRRLAQWLKTLRQQGRIPDTNEDPLLADLIWWKGDRVLVVEVSLKVDDNDIRRARLRAETLRAVGVDATPVVIGEEWAAPQVQALAQQEQVEWMVGSGLSQGFLQFRQLPDEVVPETTEH